MKQQEKKNGGGSDGVYERVNVEEQERLVKKFKYTEDIQFGFNDQALVINFENYNIVLKFNEISYQNIALFDRFKTNEKIYDGKYTASKNVPAFKNASSGNLIKYSRSFEQEGKVVLNYYIKYEGEMVNEEKYSKALDFAVSKINEMVKVDTKMINENYTGDNLILYSGEFNIILGNNKIEREDRNKYNQYLNTDVEFVTFSFDPNVVEVKKNDLQYIKDNLSKVLSYSCVDYSTDVGTYDYKTERWTREYKFELPRYDLYYSQLRWYYYTYNNYSWGSSYRNTFKDVYLVSDNNKLIDRDELTDYLINNKDELAQVVYDNSPEIWNYKDINRDNYIVNVDSDGQINVSFPYTYFYTAYDTGELVYYDTTTYFGLQNNSIDNYDYSRRVTIEKYMGVT